jgi:hypothetical protein
MIYILTRDDGQRVRWWPDSQRVEAQQTLTDWDRWNHGVWRLETADNDDLQNEYPRDEIPDAMGGSPVALMDDGGTLCEFCVADPFNPVWDGRDKPQHSDGWEVRAWFNSAETEGFLACDHCNRVLHEGEED